MVSFMYNTGKCKLIYGDRNQISGCLGPGMGQMDGGDSKETLENFLEDCICSLS